MRERGVKLLHHFGSGAFLRTVDGGSSARPTEGIVDIGSECHFKIGQPRVHCGDINALQSGQHRATEGHVFAISIKEPGAERLCHAGTTVIGGTAADADNQLSAAVVERSANQLASAAGGGDKRIALLRGHQRQAGSGSHLNHGGGVIAQNSPVSVHPFFQRSGDLCGHHFTAGSIDQGLHRAFTAVGHWFQYRFCIRHNALHPFLNGPRHFQRGEVSFKSLRGNYNLHGIAPSEKCWLRSIFASGVPVGLVKQVHDFQDRYRQLLLACATGKLHDTGRAARN